jgi:hypothetical protein
MDDKTKGLIDRLLELERIAQQATPGPWCVESLGEKGDGSHVIGVAFGPDDQNAERPLSGWLEPFDKDGNEIDYYRDEEVAVCEHRNRNSGPNAIYIMTFDPPTVLAMIATIRAQAEKIERIQQKGVVIMEMYEAEFARIKSAVCPYQRLIEWWLLWRDHHDLWMEGAPIERMPDDLNRAASMISKLYALLEQADAVIAYECFDRSTRRGDINKWADEALERYENRLPPEAREQR